MADTRRLAAKMDEAIRALKPQKRQGQTACIELAQILRERLGQGRPFEVLFDGKAFPVKCDGVRISRTTVDLGVPNIDSRIPLTRIVACETGKDGEGNPIMGHGIVEDDGAVTTVVLR